jgi:hypothetical protein
MNAGTVLWTWYSPFITFHLLNSLFTSKISHSSPLPSLSTKVLYICLLDTEKLPDIIITLKTLQSCQIDIPTYIVLSWIISQEKQISIMLIILSFPSGTGF